MLGQSMPTGRRLSKFQSTWYTMTSSLEASFHTGSRSTSLWMSLSSADSLSPMKKLEKSPSLTSLMSMLEKIRFQTFSFEETVAVLHLKLENMNDFDLGLNALDYEIWLCDVRIGGAELSKSANLAKRGITYVDVPITFRPKDFGLALWDMIRGMGTGYTIKGNINVDTPFGATKLPIVKEGGTTRLKKNKEDGGDDDDDEEWRGMLGWQVKLVVDVVCLSVLVLENNRQTGT